MTMLMRNIYDNDIEIGDDGADNGIADAEDGAGVDVDANDDGVGKDEVDNSIVNDGKNAGVDGDDHDVGIGNDDVDNSIEDADVAHEVGDEIADTGSDAVAGSDVFGVCR